jgi:hypothetical protein
MDAAGMDCLVRVMLCTDALIQMLGVTMYDMHHDSIVCF